MSTVLSDPILAVLFWTLIKVSVLLGLVTLAQAAIHRRASAASRHLVWTLAVAGVLALPLLSAALPSWPVFSRTVVTRGADVPVASVIAVAEPVILEPSTRASLVSAPPLPVSSNRQDQRISWLAAVMVVYGTGLVGMLLHFVVQRRRVRRLANQAIEVRDAEWTCLLADCRATMGLERHVRLLRSREAGMPMAFGTRRPSILIPATADTWSEDRRRAVLLHELAHVARLDCLTQTLAFAACAVYWFHPFVWLAARRLRIERELACDDRVIVAGARAREYAGHLLEIAYSFGSHRAPAPAVSMARPRQLEGRMLAVLDAARNRRVPTRRARLIGAAAAVALIVPLAAGSARVVAVEQSDERSTKAAIATATTARDPLRLETLRSWDTWVAESGRRLVRAAAAAVASAQDGLPGTWEIRPTEKDGTVHLRLVERNSSSGTEVPIQRLEGLTGAQLTGAGGPVQFRIRRDAGTFSFEGVVRSGVGAGTFSFTPDPSFPAELVKRGFARPTPQQQYQLARHDVGYAFVDELNRQGYTKPETAELVRAGQHGVHVTYLREMGELGYRLGSLAPLIELRDHGVTPRYIRDLADLGYKGLSADLVRRARDHGISPEYVRGLRDAGYGSLPMDQLITARDHGVNAEFINGLAGAGHRKLPLDQVIRVRDHGVSPEYARDMRQLGYGVPIDDLVRARDHGVSVEFVRDFNALGYSNVPLDSMIRLRDHGVRPEYVRELKALGYDRLSIDDLVTLRDHGLSAERIRTANSRAGTRLPVDLLKAFGR